MQKRISKGGHEYEGRQIEVGETIMVDEIHIPLLLAMGWIEPKKGELGYVQPSTDTEQRSMKRQSRTAA